MRVGWCSGFSLDGQFVVSEHKDGVMRLWKVQSRRFIRKRELAEVVGKFRVTSQTCS